MSRRPRPPGPPPPAAGPPSEPGPAPKDEASRKKRSRARSKRSWAARAAELALWAAVSLATAFILVRLSERILPTNF